MKTTFIIALCSFFISASALAQEQSVKIEYMQDGKKVVKEYKGTELDKLIREAKVKSAAVNKASQKNEAPAENQVIIQQQGKEPVIYKGAELDKLMQQAQQASASQNARPKLLPQSSATYSITAVRQADGSVKYLKSGPEKIEK